MLAWPPAATSGPCTVVDPACREWLSLAEDSARASLYRSFGLGERNERLVRALVIVHGASRDAAGALRTALAAAFLAGALEDTAVVAPRFASNGAPDCRMALAPGEINWACPLLDWRWGGVAVGNEQLASFDSPSSSVTTRTTRAST